MTPDEVSDMEYLEERELVLERICCELFAILITLTDEPAVKFVTEVKYPYLDNMLEKLMDVAEIREDIDEIMQMTFQMEGDEDE